VVKKVFVCLDQMEKWLGERRYLAGDKITEADWRAFPTLLRFDPVYHGHFKCNLRRVQDYPNLVNYLRELYQWRGSKRRSIYRRPRQAITVSATSTRPASCRSAGHEPSRTAA